MQSELKNLSLKVLKLGTVFLMLTLLVSFYAWNELPAEAIMPLHWNISGQPDGFGGKFEGLFFVPFILLLCALITAIMPMFVKKSEGLVRSAKAYVAVMTAIFLLLFVVHCALVLSALGWRIDMSTLLPITIGAVLLVCGNYMPKTGPNCIMGVRTRSTLTSEYAWFKTHRLAGRIFVVLGVLTLAVAALPRSWAGPATIAITAALVLASIYLMWYARKMWERDPERKK